MVGAQRRAKAFERSSDDGLLIYRHRHCLAHFRVAGQHRVVKVEVQCLEGVLGGRIDERIVLEALHRLKILDIRDQAGDIEGARPQLLESELSTINAAEDDLVQEGQSFPGQVIFGVAHHSVVITRHALRHHEWTTRYLRIHITG